MASPFITTVVDVVTLLIYFQVARAILQLLTAKSEPHLRLAFLWFGGLSPGRPCRSWRWGQCG